MKSLLRLLCSAALASAAWSAQAAAYTSLVVFGDSLSDPGNAAALTSPGPFFPPPPYAGTFSNGPTAAQYLAASYGAPVVLGWPSAAGATNFAVGGALTGAGNYNFLVNSPSGLTSYPAVGGTGIAQQIARYDASGLNPDSTLFLLFGGPNDFFLAFAQAQAGLTVDFNAVTAQAVGNLAADITALATLGARNILVPNMADLGLTPFFIGAGLSPTATALSNGFNAGLDAVIDLERASLSALGVHLYEFDTAQFFRNAIDAPSGGLTNVTSSCLAGGAAALVSGCAGYLFFDSVHPTTLAHSLLASELAVAATPVPEPEVWALMLAGIAALGWRAKRRTTAL